MRKHSPKFAALGVAIALATGTASAVEGPVPTGIPRLDRTNAGFSGITPEAVGSAVAEVLAASRRQTRHSLP